MSTVKLDFSVCMQQYKKTIEGLLVKILPETAGNNSLLDAMRYSALNGGKRLRPALVYAVGEVLGVTQQKLHAAAISVELIHCYTLIHDDLPCMDDDDLRRGLPSCHRAFDEATAILAGDALQSLAFQVLSDPELNPVGAQKQIVMVNVLAQAIGAQGLVLGQAEDLAAEHRVLNLQELSTLHSHKTGALFNACIKLSTLAMQQELAPTTLKHLLTYGYHLGLAFQIQDDVLDVIGDAAIIGKPVGSDQALQKATFTSLLGVEAAQAHAQRNLHLALAALASFGDDADILRDLAGYLVNRNT